MVVSLRHEQAEREAPKHHFYRRLPGALLGLHRNDFRRKRQVLLGQPQVCTKVSPQRGHPFRQVSLTLCKRLEFAFLVS